MEFSVLVQLKEIGAGGDYSCVSCGRFTLPHGDTADEVCNFFDFLRHFQTVAEMTITARRSVKRGPCVRDGA